MPKRYSNRKLKGLPIPKEILIKSLSQYIDFFSKNNYTNYVFRGEPTNYHSTIASALRDSTLVDNLKNISPYINMKNEFYREVYHKLSFEERKSFLAFAQHHGIPTNLVDFTKSPIIALYFACQESTTSTLNFEKERGFVYLKENCFLDISTLVEAFPDKNILNLFADNNEEVYTYFINSINIYSHLYPSQFYFYFKNLVSDLKYHFKDKYSCITKKPFPQYQDGKYEIDLTINIEELVDDTYPNELELFKRNKGSFASFYYTLLLKKFLSDILNYTEPVFWLNCIPNFIYNPILTFERGRNQQGLFLYQSFLYYTDAVYQSHILSLQRIWPDLILVIENKESILKDLDFIGINEKFIYGDYDSIARHLKKKYCS